MTTINAHDLDTVVGGTLAGSIPGSLAPKLPRDFPIPQLPRPEQPKTIPLGPFYPPAPSNIA